jgi:DamX protein
MNEMLKSYSHDTFAPAQEQNIDVFRNGQWGQCLDLVKHLCQYSENILLVSANLGMGKTTLKDTLKNTADKNFKFLDLQASTILSVSKLMQSIAVGFGISFDPQEAPTTNIKNNVWVLLIDDAELLSLDLISALFQLRDSAKGLLHIVLFAKPSLESRILESTWREACETYVHVIELEPLTLSETESLLQHQWRLVGNRVNLPFDRAAINNIYSLSGGITSEVLKLAKSQINGEGTTKHKTLLATFLGVLSPVMLGLTVLFGIVFILISFFLPAELNSLATNATETQPENAEVVMLEEASSNELIEATAEHPELVDTMPMSADATLSKPVEENTTVQQAIAENNLLMQKTEQVSENLALPGALSAATQTIDEAKPELQETKPVALAPTPNKTLALQAQLTANEQDILKIAADKFTIQLLGAAQEKRVLDFIASNNLSDKARYYRTTHNNKPWFILIYGDYSSRLEAQTAVKELPKDVQSLKPWTRDLASIQKVIKKES